MVVDVRQEFHALGARAAEERIVDDDSATTSGVCQRFDGFVDDPRRKEQREPAPVRVTGVQEAVGRVLAKRQGFLVKPALHAIYFATNIDFTRLYGCSAPAKFE